MKIIPWMEMLKIASHQLNIQPNYFWQLTMFEFIELIKPIKDSKSLITQNDLQQLMKLFPD